MGKHNEPHPLAGQTVKVKLRGTDVGGGESLVTEIRIEDWFDRVMGRLLWDNAWPGNYAVSNYAYRSGSTIIEKDPIPTDDEMVYGKFNSLGYVVHVSEFIEEE